VHTLNGFQSYKSMQGALRASDPDGVRVQVARNQDDSKRDSKGRAANAMHE
jgi:hypothetical protein